MDIAAAVQRLVTNFGLSELAALPSFQELIGHLAALTHTVLTEVAAAAVNDDDMVQVSDTPVWCSIAQVHVYVFNDIVVTGSECKYEYKQCHTRNSCQQMCDRCRVLQCSIATAANFCWRLLLLAITTAVGACTALAACSSCTTDTTTAVHK
jgi:hypothetical protein